MVVLGEALAIALEKEASSHPPLQNAPSHAIPPKSRNKCVALDVTSA